MSHQVEEEWDEDFNPIKAVNVTLRDTGGKLYCVQARFLIEQSGFFADMLSDITATDEPIEAELNSAWTKGLLKYITRYVDDMSSDDHTALIQRSFSGANLVRLAELYLWSDKYQFDRLTDGISKHLASRRTSAFSTHESIVGVIKVASRHGNIHLTKIALRWLDSVPKQPSLEEVESIGRVLPSDWKEAFYLAFIQAQGISQEGRPHQSGSLLSRYFGERLNYAAGEPAIDHLASTSSNESYSACKKSTQRSRTSDDKVEVLDRVKRARRWQRIRKGII